MSAACPTAPKAIPEVNRTSVRVSALSEVKWLFAKNAPNAIPRYDCLPQTKAAPRAIPAGGQTAVAYTGGEWSIFPRMADNQ